MKRWYVSLTAAGLFATGCGGSSTQPASPPPSNSAPSGKGSIQAVVDGITGQTAVERGKEAKVKLQAIGSNEQSAITEILE